MVSRFFFQAIPLEKHTTNVLFAHRLFFFSKKVFGQFLLLTSAKARHDFAHLRTVELMLIHDPIIGMPSSVPDKQFTFAPETNQFLHADYKMCYSAACA